MAKRNTNTGFNFAALIAARIESADALSAYVAVPDPKRNDDNPFADTAKAASVIQDEAQLADYLKHEAIGEAVAEEYKGQAKLRKMLVTARVIKLRSISIEGDAGKAFVKRNFPEYSEGSRTTVVSHLRTLCTAVEAGVVDDIVRSVWQRRTPGAGSLYNIALSAFSAAKKAAKDTGKAMALPDKSTLDAVVAKGQEPPAPRTGASAAPVTMDKLDTLADTHAKAFRPLISDEKALEEVVNALRTKLRAFLPAAKAPVTDANALASPAH